MIEIKGVTKALGNNLVLDEVNLSIEEGKVFGLVGVNGAGKSTLLRCLAGIYKPESGEVVINGKQVYENPHVKQDIVLINDDPYYPLNATVDDIKNLYASFYALDEKRYETYVSLFKLVKQDIVLINDDPYYPLNATVDDIKNLYASFYALDEKRYETYVSLFKLDRKKVINNFSKGMKRQVFLIMALAISPKVLILDEAFDGLDPFVRLTFKRALTDLIEEKNITVIISSHNLRELEDICDSFGILENHHIVTSGDIQEGKDNIHKMQLVFKDNVTKDMLTNLDIIHFDQVGRVMSLVVKGNIDEIKAELNQYHPLLMEVLAISFEEMFIYEMEERGYRSYE